MAYSPLPISSHSRFSFPNIFHCLLFSHQCHFCFPVVYLVFHNSFFFQFFFSTYFIKISAYYFSPEIISVAPHCLQYQVQLAWVADGYQVLLYLRPHAFQPPHLSLSSPAAKALYMWLTNHTISLNLCTCYFTQRMTVSWMAFKTERKHLFLLIALSFSLFRTLLISEPLQTVYWKRA